MEGWMAGWVEGWAEVGRERGRDGAMVHPSIMWVASLVHEIAMSCMILATSSEL